MLKRVIAALGFVSSLVLGADLTVDAAGSGGAFKTVQEALAAVPKGATKPIVIRIRPGTYHGHFIVPKELDGVQLIGEDAAMTTLTWNRNVYDERPEGADKFNPGLFVAGDDFVAENLTIENTSGDHGQALALRIDGDRAIVRNCRLVGWQDTLMINNGRQYFENCHIEGRVDFIYGSGTAVFSRCFIQSKNQSYVTAASTPQDHPFGFVFLDCILRGDAAAWDPATTNPATTQQARKPDKLTYLGRPWRPYGSVMFLRCDLGDHIRPEGWHNWRNPENEKTARYAEYKNIGPGANTDNRVTWSRQLTDDEAAKITVQSVLAGSDGWDPTRR